MRQGAWMHTNMYDPGIGKNFNIPVVPSDETIRFVKKLAFKKFRSSSPCWHCSCSRASTWTQTVRILIKTNPNSMILSTDIKKLKHNEAPSKAAKTRCSQCKGICHEVVTCSHSQNMSIKTFQVFKTAGWLMVDVRSKWSQYAKQHWEPK